MLDAYETNCDLRPSGGDHSAPQRATNAGQRAIEAAFSMRFANVEDCFRWLYDYGAEPLTPARANAPGAACQIFSDAQRATLTYHFNHNRQGNWHSWSAPDLNRPPVWKVYLNPTFDALSRFELAIGACLTDPRVAAFKTVSHRWMALRPDKLMVYFATRQSRADWLADTRDIFPRFAANPVPFTRHYDPKGMATLAEDPQDNPGQSWRSTLLRRIAQKIVSSDVTSPEQLYHALHREGIDPQRWEIRNAH